MYFLYNAKFGAAVARLLKSSHATAVYSTAKLAVLHSSGTVLLNWNGIRSIAFGTVVVNVRNRPNKNSLYKDRRRVRIYIVSVKLSIVFVGKVQRH